MSDATEKIYEMLWDCPYCGSIKLLGKTHRHCPVCGAAQDPATRYFPPEEEKVAVQDHVYFGADLNCTSCQAPNSARAAFCVECGSPLEGASQVALVADPSEAPGVPHEGGAKKKSKKGAVIAIVVSSVVALLVATVLVLVFWTETVAIAVAGHTWQREIQIEDFASRSKSEWCNQMPTDAREVTRKQEVRSYKQVPDGQDCRTVSKDRGDGTFTQQQKCTTKYRKEPVYDQKCHFTVDRWEYARSVTAQGRSLADVPIWPTVQLKKTGQGIGAERQGKQVEKYTVHFTGAESMTATCDFPQASY